MNGEILAAESRHHWSGFRPDRIKTLTSATATRGGIVTTAVPVAHSAHQSPRRAEYRLIIDGSQHSHTSVHPGRAAAVGALADYAEGPGFELTATQTADTYTAYELADPATAA